MDFAASVVAEAKRRHPGLDFRRGDAEDLPFGDTEFDAVAMSFGLLHLARPEQALHESHRVLRPGGMIAFTVWAPPGDAKVFSIVLHALETHGKTDVGLPPGPPFFRFSDPEECRRTLEASGFVEPSVTKVPMVWRVPSAEAYFRAMVDGTVRTRGVLKAQTPEAFAAIRQAVVDAANAYRTENGIELPAPAVLAAASKP